MHRRVQTTLDHNYSLTCTWQQTYSEGEGEGETDKSIFITMDDSRQIFNIFYSAIFGKSACIVALHDENAENDYTRYLIFVDVSLLVFKFRSSQMKYTSIIYFRDIEINRTIFSISLKIFLRMR